MGCYRIEGGHRLSGEIDVHGAKNAALPVLAATLINSGKNVIHNCPELTDIDNMTEILEYLGCYVKRDKTDLIVDSSRINNLEIPGCMMEKTRSSTLFAGALAARRRCVTISESGGCCIGKRPIDMHIEAFREMGMDVSEEENRILCRARILNPCVIKLRVPSVGATENAMLASSLTCGTTLIINAAAEPEISNLADFLRSIGVCISGDGTHIVSVRGTKNPTDGETDIIGDRIVAATYGIGVAVAGGSVKINKVNPYHLSTVIAIIRNMGAKITVGRNSFTVLCDRRLSNPSYFSTGPYPYFPTDCQPLLMALMSMSSGVGVVKEKIFENRFGHCERLKKMGADISVYGNCACVNGVKRLKGARVDACDLRSGAALVCAALGADGTSDITHTSYIERGYENIVRDFKAIGAVAERIE